MRRFLSVLGAATLVIVIAIGVGTGMLIHEGRALDAESKMFVDNAVPAITANWSEKQLLDRTAPQLRDGAKPGELRALFDAVSPLGPVLSYEGATGEANISHVAGYESVVSASYIAKAKFKNGAAAILIWLVKRDRRWMISGFHVSTSLPGASGRAA